MTIKDMMKLVTFGSLMTAAGTGCVQVPVQGYTQGAAYVPQQPEAQTAIVIKENADGSATTNFVQVAAQPVQQPAQTKLVFAPGQFFVNTLETVNSTADHYAPTIGTALGVMDTVNGFRSVNAQKKTATAINRVGTKLNALQQRQNCNSPCGR